MRKTFLRKQPTPPEAVLQITSMADIFLILLVFLLKGYASAVTTIAPSGTTRLPVATTAATSRSPVKDAVQVEISRDALLVDNRPIVPLDSYLLPVTAEADRAIDRALEREREKPRPAESPGGSSSLLLLADERAPYATVERVLGRLAAAGYVDLQLVVVKER